MKYVSLLVLLTFKILPTAANENNLQKSQPVLSFRYHNGFVMPHHKSISYIVQERTSAFELNVGFRPQKPWAQLLRNPETGIGLYRGSLGNKKILGHATALFPYIDIPFSQGNKFHFSYRIGIGLAVHNKKFDPVNNYANIAIGSKLNAFLNLTLNAKTRLYNNFYLSSGIGFSHVSNGAMKVPNKGINILAYNLGVKYDIEKKNFRPKSNKGIKGNRLPNELAIIGSGGSKQATEIDPHYYFTGSLSATYLWGINATQRLGTGIDVFYDESTNRGKWDLDPQVSFANRLKQAIIISHELAFSKLIFITHLGVYTLYKENPPKPIYSRIGVRYKFTSNLLANVSLKAHLGKADFIEWGIGYYWNRSKKYNGKENLK